MMNMRNSENVFGNPSVSKCVNKKTSNNMKSFKVSSLSIMDRDERELSSYLNEVRQYSCVSCEEEARLIRTMKKGGYEGECAKVALINANLRFVISVANYYNQCSGCSVLTVSDLISEGNIGLVKAAEMFDDSHECKFITYAESWIRKFIIEALYRYSNAVRIPLSQQKLLVKYNRKRKEMEQRTDIPMSVEEFAASTNTNVVSLHSTIAASRKSMSTDELVSDDSKQTVVYKFASANSTDLAVEENLLCEGVEYLLAHTLSEREVFIVSRYFGIGCQQMTFDEIATDMGMSREGVRKIYMKAFDKLKRSLYAKELAGYLTA
ncbi:MAG: sigma-70 family RNA polymerase sigma factor [Bacteroidaceae bacterium]|nr:sigma-70 family RNA polymerase sigma factor [Bacteroidaceae bacterium]